MPNTASTVQHLREGFLQPDPAARVMMRWWWFGPEVDRDDLLRDLDRMSETGLGGVECAFVYPMSGHSDRFLSDTFLGDLRFAAQAAEARGLRFDVTLGSGWPYGGPHIDATTASRRIHWESEEVLIHEQVMPLPLAWPHDDFIAAYIGDGTAAESPREFTQLHTDMIDGVRCLRIPQGKGPRVVLTAVSRPTGQTLKRASAGAEGWALDHFSRAATQVHLAAVGEPLVHAAGSERIGTVFCDSLEVYHADWTPLMASEFATRRGYDPLPELWRLTTQDAQNRGFRSDYYRTLTELLEENFIAVVAQWAHTKGLRFRIQGYGEPPATVSSFRHADAFEGEGWGWDAVTACRWATSAAQIYGEQVVSSETWTWVHSPSFRATPLDILGEAHDHLLMGINQFVGHGWPTSARPTERSGDSPPELGRVFYASGALDDRNAWWDAAPALWKTLHRLSWIMRQGTRLSQVGIYVPARDVYAGFAAVGRQDLFKETRQHIGQELPRAVRTSGCDFDLFDDDAVAVLDPARFPVVVLPWAQDLPHATRHWLAQVTEAGGQVLDLGASAGVGIPVQEPRSVIEFLSGISGIHLMDDGAGAATGRTPEGVAVSTREIAGETAQETVRIHFVANTQNSPAQVVLRVGTEPRSESAVSLERWDAETGDLVEAVLGPQMALSLEAYEAAVVIEQGAMGTPEPFTATVPGLEMDSGGRDATPSAGEPPRSTVRAIEEWSVQFPDENVPRPVAVPHQWEADPSRRQYSGSAAYTAQIHIPAGARSVLLDLGATVPHRLEDPQAAGLMEASFSAAVRIPVGSVAAVEVDGQHSGFLWKTPYRIDLTDWVTPGRDHQLRLIVANVTSHRLAVDAGIPRLVHQAEEAFGKRFGIQTLDLAMADVASGLLAVPHLQCVIDGDQETP